MPSRWPSAERQRLLAGCSVATALAAVVLCAAVAETAFAAAHDDPQMAEGRSLFVGGATPPCAICHTLKDAGATGAVGPVLDELRPDEARVAAAVRGGIGAMPSFAGSLSDAQIRSLARYVAKASGATP